jgi:myo-inositol-1-phosphate synthase
VFIASNPEWAQKFTDAGVPIVGDDIKSQVGATITHRLLARLFEDRGSRSTTRTSSLRRQHGLQGMLERERLLSKKVSKTQSVTSQIDQGISSESAHRPVRPCAVAQRPQVGLHPARGRNFGDVLLNVELKLEVWDSPTRRA